MRFEDVESENHSHKIVFCGEEISVISAAFREKLYSMARSGNSLNASITERIVSDWEPDVDERAIFMNISYTDTLANLLSNFSHNTDREITRMPYNTRVAVFENDSMATRIRLGQVAAEMAAEVRTFKNNHNTAKDLLSQITMPAED